MNIGFDNYSINYQLKMALLADEYDGRIAYDRSKSHMPFTLEGAPFGPSWGKTEYGMPYLSLNGTVDSIQCAGALSTAVNFTSESFTMLLWVNGTPTATDILMAQGVTDTDGWEFFVSQTVNTLSLRLNQGGAHTDIAAVGCFTPAIWQLLSITRNGASGQFYVNGEPRTMTLGAGLTDAVSCAGGDILYIGRKGVGNYFGGYIGGGRCGPRIWDRVLTDTENRRIFNAERDWFGV